MHAIIIREKAGSTGTKGRVLGSITNLCFSAKSKQKRVNQIRLVATYMEENGWGTDGRIDYAGGDFNFVEALVDHWAKDSDGHYRCGIDSNQRLGSDSVAWRDLMRLKLGWEEVYQPAPTLRGTNQTFWSRNDGIFLITNPGLTSMLQLSAEALERVPMLSGHGAVRLHNKPQHVNRFPNMKIWVAKDPDYKELLQRKLEMNINSEDGAWDQYNVMLQSLSLPNPSILPHDCNRAPYRLFPGTLLLGRRGGGRSCNSPWSPGRTSTQPAGRGRRRRRRPPLLAHPSARGARPLPVLAKERSRARGAGTGSSRGKDLPES